MSCSEPSSSTRAGSWLLYTCRRRSRTQMRMPCAPLLAFSSRYALERVTLAHLGGLVVRAQVQSLEGPEQRDERRQVRRAVGAESDPLQTQPHVAVDLVEGCESSSCGEGVVDGVEAIAVHRVCDGELRELALALLEKGIVLLDRLLLRSGLCDVVLEVTRGLRRNVEGLEGCAFQRQSFEDLHFLFFACDGAGTLLDASGVLLDGVVLFCLLALEGVDGSDTALELSVEFGTALGLRGAHVAVHASAHLSPSLSSSLRAALPRTRALPSLSFSSPRRAVL